jgi:hypothetical protein
MQFLTNIKISKKKIILILSFFAIFYSFYSLFNSFDFRLVSGAKSTTVFSLKEVLKTNIVFRNYFLSFAIKNIIILLPFLFSALKRNTNFAITYSLSLFASINAIQFYGTLQEADIFISMIIIGNISLFKIIGSNIFSNLATAASLFAFAICANTINHLNIEHFVVSSLLSITIFTACFKIENLIKNKNSGDRKNNFYKRKFRKR